MQNKDRKTTSYVKFCEESITQMEKWPTAHLFRSMSFLWLSLSLGLLKIPTDPEKLFYLAGLWTGAIIFICAYIHMYIHMSICMYVCANATSKFFFIAGPRPILRTLFSKYGHIYVTTYTYEHTYIHYFCIYVCIIHRIPAPFRRVFCIAGWLKDFHLCVCGTTP